MLEIFLLIRGCKKIGEMVRAKGRTGAAWFQTLLVLSWFGGEIIGFLCAIFVGIQGPPAYLFGILGGVAGAVATFIIVNSLSPADSMSHRGFEVGATPVPSLSGQPAPASPPADVSPQSQAV